jgi:rod shape-determining protein MreC
MLRRPHYIALGLAGLLTVVLLNLPTRTAGKIKLAIGSVFLPLFGLSRTSQQLVHEAGDGLTSRKDLERQNEELRRTNEWLRIQMMQSAPLMRENERLRQLVGRPPQQQVWKLKFAKVMVRDPANWWQSFVIDLGQRDGMKPDLPVLTAEGLLGRVSEVSLATSKVELIGNPTCKVSALVEKTGETGIISGSLGLFDFSLVTLSYFSSSSVSKPGQIVVTSGLGGVFPAGIVIGQIAEEARPVEFGLRTEGRVKLAANPGTLEVWVLMQ